jgi:hypothetical protein
MVDPGHAGRGASLAGRCLCRHPEKAAPQSNQSSDAGLPIGNRFASRLRGHPLDRLEAGPHAGRVLFKKQAVGGRTCRSLIEGSLACEGRESIVRWHQLAVIRLADPVTQHRMVYW